MRGDRPRWLVPVGLCATSGTRNITQLIPARRYFGLILATAAATAVVPGAEDDDDVNDGGATVNHWK